MDRVHVEKAADAGVHFGDAGGNEVEDVAIPIVEGGEDTTAEIGFDLGAEVGKGGSRHWLSGGAKSIISLFVRLEILVY